MRTTITAVGVALALAALPSTALASGPSCGDTITRDTTLTRDLTNCPGDGLVIGADGVMLNLNGHTIDGVAASEDTVGVANRDGHARLAVVDGTVQEFGVGVFTAGGANDRLRGVELARNVDVGAVLQNAEGARVTQNAFRDNGIVGLVLGGADQALVAHNTASGHTSGYAFALFGVNDGAIRDNSFDGNEHGILLAGASSRSVVERNLITHSGGSAIDLGDGVTDDRVRLNRLADNGDGIIVVDGRDIVVSHNLVTGTGFFGLPDTGGFGVVVDGGDHTTVTGNVVTGGRGPALFVTVLEAPSSSQNTALTGNVASSRRDDGIRVDAGAAGTLVAGNDADRSGDDGIDAAAGTTVSRNSADRNHDLGIEAAPGATDGGGNRAHGNGNPLQCRNVACR